MNNTSNALKQNIYSISQPYLSGTFGMLLFLLVTGMANAQPQVDSLELYNPFTQAHEINIVLSKYFTILGSKNQLKLQKITAKIDSYHKSRDSVKAAGCFLSAGDIYFRTGMYNEALKNYFNAKKIYDTMHDSIRSAYLEIKIGRVYYFSDISVDASNRPRAFKILRSSKDSSLLAYSYNAEAIAEENEQKRAALFNRAIEIQRAVVSRKPNDTTALESLSAFLNASGRVEEAIQIIERTGNGWLLVLYLNNLGYDKVLQGKYNESLPIYYRSLKICKDERFLTLLRNTYDNLGRVYRLMGKLDRAIAFMQLQHYVEGFLFGEQFNQQALEYKNKVEAEKKEMENEFLRKEQSTLQDKIALEKIQKMLLLLSLAGASLTAAFIYISRRKMQSVNKLLDEKNAKLAGLYDELQTSEENLKSAQATAQLANWEWDLTTNSFTFSQQLPRIFSINPTELQKDFKAGFLQKIHPNDYDKVQASFEEYDIRNNNEETIFRIIKDERTHWIKGKRVFIHDMEGNVLHIKGTVQDITDIKEEEEIKLQIAAQMSFTKQLLASQEEERKRIAGELHDSLGQDVLLIKNRAQIGLQNEDIDKASLEQFTQINKETTNLLKVIREISFNLRPAHLESIGLTETIITAIKRASASTQIHFTYSIDNIDDVFTIEIETHIFRIIQEGMNNILKHSEATQASIEIVEEESTIHLQILDNGKGFVLPSGKELYSGFGLTSLQNRVTILNGTIQVHSEIQKGTRISITIPKG